MISGHDSALNCYLGQESTLKFDPGSWFHVEMLPRVLIPHWNMTLGLNSTLNCDPESWLNVELWPGRGITIQCGIPTRGHNSTWNFDPGSQLNVEFWPVYISSTRGIATQDGVKIQQRDQNSTAKEGHNSTKNPLNIDPGSVFNRGSKFYLTPATQRECIYGGLTLDVDRHSIGSTTATTHQEKGIITPITHQKDTMEFMNFQDRILDVYV